ncbi:MAG: hypothetical protein ACK6AD_03145 [Cyanobacteriota bacterium]
MPSPALTAISLVLLSTLATGALLLVLSCAQIVAQRPASRGVLVVHLGKEGGLRLWHQPIRPQEIPVLLERARTRSGTSSPLVVRLIPEPEVPWGAVNVMLNRLRPPMLRPSWTLQLQLP